MGKKSIDITGVYREIRKDKSESLTTTSAQDHCFLLGGLISAYHLQSMILILQRRYILYSLKAEPRRNVLSRASDLCRSEDTPRVVIMESIMISCVQSNSLPHDCIQLDRQYNDDRKFERKAHCNLYES